MPVEQANTATKIVVSDILSTFSREYSWEYGDLADHRDKVYLEHGPTPVDTTGLHSELGGSDEIGWMSQRRFLTLEPIEGSKTFLPLVTLHSECDWVIFRIYALVTLIDDDSNLQSLAIRFETDENGLNPESSDGKHDFCHAQLCNVIGSNTRASTPAWFPEHTPAIPLDADNQVSLVLCMLTSLYGGAYVYRKLSSAGQRDLRKHLKEVRALRSLLPDARC